MLTPLAGEPVWKSSTVRTACQSYSELGEVLNSATYKDLEDFTHFKEIL